MGWCSLLCGHVESHSVFPQLLLHPIILRQSVSLKLKLLILTKLPHSEAQNLPDSAYPPRAGVIDAHSHVREVWDLPYSTHQPLS